jgi:hypothetical protein
MAPPGGIDHHFNYGQKIFQIGSESSLGIAMWGLGGLADLSYRTLIASFADELKAYPAKDVEEIANRWNNSFWTAYTKSYGSLIQRARDLNSNPSRTQPEHDELAGLRQQLSGGFCLGGYCLPDRTPRAFQVVYEPTFDHPQATAPLQVGGLFFWGVPNLINSLIYGIDPNIFSSILNSGRWNGNATDLSAIVAQHWHMPAGVLPLRDATDWVDSLIYATIKGLKFSNLAPLCGGPIEIAVISSDRPFRWVKHKRFSVAIERGLGDGDLR